MFHLLLKLLVLPPIFLLVGFWVVSFRMGGVVPGDFVRSEIPISELKFDDWKTYGGDEWFALALKLREKGDLRGAELAARKVLQVDPTNGGVVGLLVQLHADKGDIKTADYLFELGSRLWPAYYRKVRERREKGQQ